ncbi:MAG: electron transport complex subunit RsxC [Nitrosomonadales bacterium]|nr:electron transport complex subunit RsxC [Nitrosomonadales bacterium]
MNAIVNISKLLKSKLGKSEHKLSTFNGGVHPPQHKLESTSSSIRVVAPPKHLVLPLRQHVGNISKLQIALGDRVLKGQLLAKADGQVSAAVHAPTSGVITSIDNQLIPHPSGLPDMSITLETDGADQWIEHQAIDYRAMSKPELLERLREAGVVGLGGATFPSHIKLREDARHPVRTLIINGAECEPYISCDDLLMRERADEIVRGVEIMSYLLDAELCAIGIEDNKPEAAKAMREAAALSSIKIDVVEVPTIYPGGGAKQLIKVITGLEVPSGRLPTEIGVQCFNVATAYSVHRVVNHGEPVLSRIVTVTGNVSRPGNYEAPLGMLISDLVELAGGKADTGDLIMGGPMMGFNLPSAKVPVVKATNCIIVPAGKMFPEPEPALPCIRCTRCADVCPVNLQPQELYWFSKSQNLEKAREYKIFDCIECGCCTYVCPSNIPLVQYYRFAKSEIIAQDRAKEAADIARERNEFRLMRIEREKQERALKHAQKAAGARTEAGAGSAADEAKKAAISAAMERAKTQKAEIAPKNTEAVSPAVANEIADIEARRVKQGEQAQLFSEDGKQSEQETALSNINSKQNATPNEFPQETPVEVPVETPREIPIETPTEVPDKVPEEMPEEIPKEIPKEIPEKPPAEEAK